MEFKNKYTSVVCINDKLAIGKDGALLYDIRNDKLNFQRLTSGNVVIMGRKTFESLPNGLPLKNRINIVVTNQENYPETIDVNEKQSELFNDTYFCKNLEEVDDLCYAYFFDKELFIVGGESLYNEAFDLGIVDKVIITHVNDESYGDVYFPDIENDERYKVIFKTTSLRDQPNALYYYYVFLKKK